MMKEEDSWVYLEEIDCLKKYSNKKRVLEIGAYKGFSATIMAPLAISVVSIDTFEGTNLAEVHRGKSTYDDFIENTKDFKNILPIIGNSHSQGMVGLSPKTIDFLFIDGDHTYEGCLSDLRNYVPKLLQNGVVGIHDFGSRYTTVIAACMNYFMRYPDEIHRTIAIYKMKNNIKVK